MDKISVKLLRPDARVPTYGTEASAGADLYACMQDKVEVGPGQSVMIPTGIAMEIPKGYAGLVFARSSMGAKRGLAPANKVGVIDSDYRGEIRVVLFNHGSVPQTIENGERIAQFIITPVLTPSYTWAEELSQTERASGGFGSTGK